MFAQCVRTRVQITTHGRHAGIKIEHLIDIDGTAEAAFARAIRLQVSTDLFQVDQLATRRTEVDDSIVFRRSLPAGRRDGNFVMFVYRDDQICRDDAVVSGGGGGGRGNWDACRCDDGVGGGVDVATLVSRIHLFVIIVVGGLFLDGFFDLFSLFSFLLLFLLLLRLLLLLFFSFASSFRRFGMDLRLQNGVQDVDEDQTE